jgi:hypothetical protein
VKNFGVDLSKICLQSRSVKWSLTIIGDVASRQMVLDDIQNDPALKPFKDTLLVERTPRTSPPAKPNSPRTALAGKTPDVPSDPVEKAVADEALNVLPFPKQPPQQ